MFVQLEQYKLVSQSFEKRVLDLQREVESKDAEIALLQKAESSFQNSADHMGLDGWCHFIANLQLFMSPYCMTCTAFFKILLSFVAFY